MGTVFSIRGSALNPMAKYRVLAGLTALGAAQFAAFALWAPEPNISQNVLWGVAVGLAAAALAVWLLFPRMSRWVIDVWVALLSAGVCLTAYVEDSASDQFAGALGLCLLVAYCGYFLPLGRMLFQLVWMIVLFVSVTIGSPHMASGLYTTIVGVTLIALAWMVSHLASLLAQAAARDPLTGTLNRRGLIEAADLVRAVVLRAERRISIVAIDLNDFKGYNDRHGHLAGDRLLADLAHAWQGVLRSADVLARTGGDEFVLVLADTDAASAHGLLARLHEANPARWSAGVVEWPKGESFTNALRRADQALYLAKSER